MQLLGHKDIKHSKVYSTCKFEGEDQFICRMAQTPEQIAELIEAGFTYVCEKDGILYFRKPK